MSATAPIAKSWASPYVDPLLDRVGRPALFDAHTHLGCDVDGTACDTDQLLALLAPVSSRAAVFPFHTDGGYGPANDAVLEIANTSGGSLVAFCRLDPGDHPVREARRALASGARGIKLHPHSEDFTFAHPQIDGILAVAEEARVPVLVHAGLGIDPLGAPLLRAARAHPGVPIILAHAAIADLAWLPDVMAETPNLFVDTSWWFAYDVLTLFAHVPPGRILFASDAPYFDPALTAFVALRCALAVGLDHDAITAIMGAQFERLLAGEAPLELGPAPGDRRLERDLRLDRACAGLGVTWAFQMSGGPMGAVARRLTDAVLALPAGDPMRPVADAAREALDLPPAGRNRAGGLPIAMALLATPGVEI